MKKNNLELNNPICYTNNVSNTNEVTNMNKELQEILNSIENEDVSYSEIAYLQSHKQEVLNTGNAILCEWARITEEEYNRGELNPDLCYDKGLIKLEVDNDGEGNAICTIVLEDKQELAVTEYELLELRNILNENVQELQEYFTQVAQQLVK